MPRSSHPHPALHVITVLDRSGSMEAVRDNIIRGWNHFVDEVRGTARSTDSRPLITHTLFNHEVDIQHFMEPLATLQHLDREGYVPDGMTALFDAVGLTLDKIVMATDGNRSISFLCQIVTDGLENASCHYSASDIAERIERLTADGNWTFAYLGANHDVFSVATDLNIPTGNVACYNASPEGVDEVWARQAPAVTTFMEDVARGQRSTARIYRD